MGEISQEIKDLVQQKYLIKRQMINDALEIIAHGDIRASLSSPNYVVKSQSLERTEYVIDPIAERCGCFAGQHERMCKHYTAYLLLRESFNHAMELAISTGEAQYVEVGRVDVVERDEEWENALP